MANHQISNYKDHLLHLKYACEWMGIDKGRAIQYESLIRDFFENSGREWQHILAYNESCELTDIYKMWESHIRDFPGLHSKIRKVFQKGPVLREDEKSNNSSNRSRNDAYVYFLAGKILKSGVKIASVDGVISNSCKLELVYDADITLYHNDWFIDVQCKRPVSPNQMQKRVSQAYQQLMESTSGGKAGIIGLDCSSIIRPNGNVIEAKSGEDSSRFLGDLIEEKIAYRFKDKMTSHVLGMILFARSPAMTKKGQTSTLKINGTPYTQYFRPESVYSFIIVDNNQYNYLAKLLNHLN